MSVDLLPCGAGTNCLPDESKLIRAAWYYINVLGDPDEGVTPDGNALDQTVVKFPGLVQEHIVHALTHIHAEVFKKSFDIMP